MALMARQELLSLISRCLEGKERAWEEFLDRYARLIWATAHRCGVSGEEAEEVFQRAWVVIVEGLGELRNPDGIVGWIVSITRHQSWRLMEENRRHRRPLEAEGETEAEDSLPQEEELLRREGGLLLHRAMDQLQRRCRRLLQLLFFVEPRPDYSVISEELDLAVGSIGPIRARCLAKLKKYYLRLYQGGEKGDS